MKSNKLYYGVLIFLIIAICAGGAALVYYIGSYLAIQPVLDQTEITGITGLTDFIKYFETAQYSQWMFWQLAGASASLVALIVLTVAWSKVAKEA